MTPQRPRPPQPARTSGPQRPPAPRPAPPRRRTGGAGGTEGTAGTAPGTGGAPGTGSTTGSPGTAATADARTSGAPTRPAAVPPAAAPVPAATRAVPLARPGGRRTSSTALDPRTGAFPVRPPVVSQGSAARFAERARARRRLAWRQILVVAGSVVAVGALAWVLLLSPVLALDTAQVRVTGAGTVVAVEQVQAVVEVEGGTPLTRLDTAALRTALLDVPGVRDATVSRDWPHGLTVALVSREPVAAVPEEAEADAVPGYALVDSEGVQVGRADAPPEGLPVVDVPLGESRILAAALGVLEALPEALLADVGSVSAGTQDTVRFVLRDGAEVEWGSAQDGDLKAAVLQALRAAPETAGSARYDVSAPTMPVVG